MGTALTRGWAVVLSLGVGCAGWADLGGTASDGATGDAGNPSAPAPPANGADGGGSGPDAASAVDGGPPSDAHDASLDAAPGLPSGILDPTFGGKGYVFRSGTGGTPVPGSQDVATAVAIDSLGRVVVGGRTQWVATHAAAWRLTGDGAFDSTFGDAGAWWSTSTTTSAGVIDEIYGVFLDAQDRPVLGGRAQTSTAASRTTAWRLTTGGALDTSFGGTGEVYSGTVGAGGGVNDWTYGVAKDALGNIVLGGAAQVSAAGNSATASWRMTAVGALDTSFGTSNGHALEWSNIDAGVGLDDYAMSVAIDHDGKIVLAGSVTDLQGAIHAALWRFTSDGVLDATFNGTGRADFALIADADAGTSAFDQAAGVAIDAQNRIVFGGTSRVSTAYSPPYGSRAYVGRLLPSGAIDKTFGTGGFTVLSPPVGAFYSLGNGLAIDSKGRIVLAGELEASSTVSVAAWRLSSTGALDASYGDAGLFSMTQTAGTGLSDRALAVAIDSQDRAVLAGCSGMGGVGQPPVNRFMAVWRLTP